MPPGFLFTTLRRADPAMGVSLHLEELDDHWRLAVAGDVDYASCSEFRLCVHRILTSTPRAAIVDLADLQYIDSAGIGILLAMSREYSALGGQLVLVTNPGVDSVLSLIGIGSVFSTASSLDEAVQMLDSDGCIGVTGS
jgi:anti-sigma B factor antagonist